MSSEITNEPCTCDGAVAKASSKAQGWMKSTKVLPIANLGCLVQVSTQQGDHVAEALTFVRGASLTQRPDGTYALVDSASLAYVPNPPTGPLNG